MSVWESNYFRSPLKNSGQLFNQVIKYSLPHTRFYQVSNHKHDIYLYGKLSAKLSAQAANKNTKSKFSIFPS